MSRSVYNPHVAKAFKATTKVDETGFPSTYLWREDDQPMRLRDTRQYIEDAAMLREEFLGIVADIIVDAGFAKPLGRDQVFADLLNIPEKSPAYFNGLRFTWRLKDPKGCEKKLLDETIGLDPANIGDYFGVKLTANSAEGIAALRMAMTRHPSMTSRKSEFNVPSGECYMSEKSHHLASRDGVSHKMELMVTHSAMEEVNDLTHHIKDMERTAREVCLAAAKNLRQLSSRFAACEEELRQIRLAINNRVAVRNGLDRFAVVPLPAPTKDNVFANLTNYTRHLLNNMPESLRTQMRSILTNDDIPHKYWNKVFGTGTVLEVNFR